MHEANQALRALVELETKIRELKNDAPRERSEYYWMKRAHEKIRHAQNQLERAVGFIVRGLQNVKTPGAETPGEPEKIANSPLPEIVDDHEPTEGESPPQE